MELLQGIRILLRRLPDKSVLGIQDRSGHAGAAHTGRDARFDCEVTEYALHVVSQNVVPIKPNCSEVYASPLPQLTDWMTKGLCLSPPPPPPQGSGKEIKDTGKHPHPPPTDAYKKHSIVALLEYLFFFSLLLCFWNLIYLIHRQSEGVKCQMPNAKCQMPNAKCQMPMPKQKQKPTPKPNKPAKANPKAKAKAKAKGKGKCKMPMPNSNECHFHDHAVCCHPPPHPPTPLHSFHFSSQKYLTDTLKWYATIRHCIIIVNWHNGVNCSFTKRQSREFVSL